MSVLLDAVSDSVTSTAWVELVPECPANTWRVLGSVFFLNGLAATQSGVLAIKTVVGPTYHIFHRTVALVAFDNRAYYGKVVIGPGQAMVAKLSGTANFRITANYAEYEEEPRTTAG